MQRRTVRCRGDTVDATVIHQIASVDKPGSAGKTQQPRRCEPVIRGFIRFKTEDARASSSDLAGRQRGKRSISPEAKFPLRGRDLDRAGFTTIHFEPCAGQ